MLKAPDIQESAHKLISFLKNWEDIPQFLLSKGSEKLLLTSHQMRKKINAAAGIPREEIKIYY